MTILFINCTAHIDYSYAIAKFIDANPGKKAEIWWGIAAGMSGGEKVETINSREDLLKSAVLAEVVIFLSEDTPDIEDDLLVSLFSYSTKRILKINSLGFASEMNKKMKSEILFVFPGPVLPLSLGSHQRAYNLLSNLKRLGYSVDLLIPKVERDAEFKLRSSLLSVCENVYFYKNKKKKIRKLDSIKRGFEKIIRKISGKDEKLQDKFSERAFNKPTESAKRILNSLYLAKKYPVIIVSYAWMMDVLDIARPFFDSETKVICDTHDVQFERSKGFLNRKERVFYSSQYEKKLELKKLNEADVILSISESDKKILEQENLKSTIINLSAGFDYQSRNIRAMPVGRPINFGFIGGAMDANVKSLDFIFREWWPTIKKHSPESKFYIAGSVVKNNQISQWMLFEDNVVPMGFVKNLDDFYNMINISLNPVFVQGGLNFKSVEAVFAGKHLITNSLGKECLGVDFQCLVVDNPDQIVDFIRKIEFDINVDKKIRQASQDKAKSIFGNKKVIKDFEKYLTEIIC